MLASQAASISYPVDDDHSSLDIPLLNPHFQKILGILKVDGDVSSEDKFLVEVECLAANIDDRIWNGKEVPCHEYDVKPVVGALNPRLSHEDMAKPNHHRNTLDCHLRQMAERCQQERNLSRRRTIDPIRFLPLNR